ncbi:MAG TPA: c-type cytochrome [Bacteroidia bacterium]|nr:c-type cytochrome [Bacteroidia bacterium]
MKSRYHFFIVIAWLHFCLISCSANETRTTSESGTVPESVEFVDSGKMLFEQKCSTCHGSDGTAGIGNAADLQKSSLDSFSIIRTITNGKNGMPAFKDQISQTGIKQVQHYVFGLRK